MNIRLFKRLHDILLELPPGPFKDRVKETIKDTEDELERLEFNWSKSEKNYQDLLKQKKGNS